MGLLERKRIVVIGGTTGLGLSAARAFVHEGAKVVVVGRSQETVTLSLEYLGSDARGLDGDAVDEQTAVRAIQLCFEAFDGFDALYHVAGGSGRRFGDGPLHEVSEQGIDYTLNLNLKSLILSNRAALQAFLKRGLGGSILNMASVLGYSPSPHFFATHVYAAAKAAIIGFTKSVASCYATRNIRFNVIAPALVETPMSQRAANDDLIQAFIKTKQPLDGGRIGCPADLDAAAIYFLSEGSRFCTGQVLAVDGGWTVSEGQIP